MCMVNNRGVQVSTGISLRFTENRLRQLAVKFNLRHDQTVLFSMRASLKGILWWDAQTSYYTYKTLSQNGEKKTFWLTEQWEKNKMGRWVILYAKCQKRLLLCACFLCWSVLLNSSVHFPTLVYVFIESFWGNQKKPFRVTGFNCHDSLSSCCYLISFMLVVACSW